MNEEWEIRLHEAWGKEERLINLSDFKIWLGKKRESWANMGLIAKLTDETADRDKNSMVIDIRSSGVSSRIVVWDSGEWEVQTADARHDTEELSLSVYRPASSLAELTRLVEAELRRQKVIG